jgi:hypothetical protein
VDAQGRIREVFRDARGTIYGAGFLTVEIPLLQPGEKRSATFYNRHGDRFGWACVVWSVVIGFRFWRGGRERTAPAE